MTIVPDVIIGAIDAAYDGLSRWRTTTIGASDIGDECDAFLALCLRGFPDVPPKPRNKRIFRDGHKIEDSIIDDLKMIEDAMGWVVVDKDVTRKDPKTGEPKQWRAEAFGGHVVGKLDGKIALTRPRPGACILEAKSMNAERFEKFKTQGVRVSDPKYFAQVQFLMGLFDMQLALFIAYCKDDSSYWLEWIDFDHFFYEGQMARVELALSGQARRKSEKKTGACNWCRKREGCWGAKIPTEECRTCSRATPITDDSPHGIPTWYCEWNGEVGGDHVCSYWTPYQPMEK